MSRISLTLECEVSVTPLLLVVHHVLEQSFPCRAGRDSAEETCVDPIHEQVLFSNALLALRQLHAWLSQTCDSVGYEGSGGEALRRLVRQYVWARPDWQDTEAHRMLVQAEEAHRIEPQEYEPLDQALKESYRDGFFNGTSESLQGLIDGRVQLKRLQRRQVSLLRKVLMPEEVSTDDGELPF